MIFEKALKQFVEERDNGTFKCPECGSKVLNNTKYCVKCKKKVADPEEGEDDSKRA